MLSYLKTFHNGRKAIIRVDIVGGEPLLRDDIEELVDYMRGKGMFMEITTNGFLSKIELKP